MIYFYDNRRKEENWSHFHTLCYFLLRGLVLLILSFTLLNNGWFYICNYECPGGGSRNWISPDVLQALALGMFLMAPFVAFDSWLHEIISQVRISRAQSTLPISREEPNNFRWGMVPCVIVIICSILSTELLVPHPQDRYTILNPFVAFFWIPSHTNFIFMEYPVFPWLTPLCIGILWGRYIVESIEKNNENTQSSCFFLFTGNGLIFFILFIILRVCNLGNFHISYWEHKSLPALEFFNPVKYPPSITYLFMSLGLLFLVHTAVYYSKFYTTQWLSKPLLSFGRAPLFFYIVHMIIVRIVEFFLTNVDYARNDEMATLYVLSSWILLLIIMFPLCHYYGKFKQSRSSTSLWKLI